METKFNEQESLLLINQMIAEARNNVKKGDGNTLLCVGYSLVVISLLDAVLMNVLTPSYMAHWVWVLMIPVTFFVFRMGNRQDRKSMVRTHIDKIATKVWSGFVWSILIVFALSFGFLCSFQDGHFGLIITPMILVLTGFAQYIASIAYKFSPFVKGAVVFWAGALLCLAYCHFMREASGLYVIFALSVVGGFIIPGHLLNRKAKDDV